MKLILPLFAHAVVSQRIARDTESDEAFEACNNYEAPESLASRTDAEKKELRDLHSYCIPYWENDPFKAFDGSCHICPCFCDARPWEPTCNGIPRGEFNKNIFLPYGAAAGDDKLDTQLLGVDVTTTVDHDFFFYGKAYREFHLSSHGFIHLRNAETQRKMDMIDRYNDFEPFGGQNMIAAFWSDFNMAYDGVVHYRAQYDNFDQLNQIVQDGTNHGMGGSTFNAACAFIVTWDTMVVTSSDVGEVNDRRNTFQAILTQDLDGNSYVIFHYGDIEQDAGSWTDADDCTGLDGWSSWVGLSTEFGDEYQLPISHTNDMEEIDKGSNVNVRGRYMLRVDGEELVAPPVVTAAPPATDAPVTNPPATDAPVTDPPATDPPATDPPATDPPATDPTATDPPATEEPYSTVTPNNNLEIDIDNNAKGIKEFITAQNGIVLENLSAITDHGCHCAVLGNPDTPASMSTEDELDQICKNWIAARKCCHKDGGLCAGQNKPVYNYANYVKSECTSQETCQNHVCDIDAWFYNEMANFFAETGTFVPNATAVCPANSVGGIRDFCCGVSPATMSAYSPNHEECVEGEVYGIGMA